MKQTVFILAYSHETLVKQDVVKILPENRKKELYNKFSSMIHLAREDNNKLKLITFSKDENRLATFHLTEGDFVLDLLGYALYELMKGNDFNTEKEAEDHYSNTKSKFTERIKRQSLVMLFAYFEAFLLDSLKLICDRKPEKMCSSKTLIIEEIIKSGSYESVMSLVREKYITEVWTDVLSTLGLFDGSFVTKCFNTDELDFFKKFLQLRHIIVHNDCKASQQFIRQTNLDIEKMNLLIFQNSI